METVFAAVPAGDREVGERRRVLVAAHADRDRALLARGRPGDRLVDLELPERLELGLSADRRLDRGGLREDQLLGAVDAIRIQVDVSGRHLGRATAVSVAVPTVADLSQIWVPPATVSPSLIGWVPAASLYIDAPVADTFASTLESTLNGPTVCPVSPVLVDGEMLRLGGGGCSSGPALITSATMAATASCSFLSLESFPPVAST